MGDISHKRLEQVAIEHANSCIELMEATRGQPYDIKARLTLKGIVQDRILAALETVWEPSQTPRRILFTDGSGTVLPNPYGWAALLLEGHAGYGADVWSSTHGYLNCWSGSAVPGTSQRAELMAILSGLGKMEQGASIEVRSDSECCVKWLTPKRAIDGSPVYRDGQIATQFQREDAFVIGCCLQIEETIRQKDLDVIFTHVRGHGRDPDPFNRYWNNVVDKVAGHARKGHV